MAPKSVSLDSVRSAIPARCFERRLVPSLLALARSVGLCALVLGAARAIEPYVSGPTAGVAFAVTYALVQGTSLVGLWVLAHECGHHAFSEYAWLDDTIGFVLHSALLVPYFAWQASHARHHAKDGHLTQGETWLPPTRSDMLLVAPLARAMSARLYAVMFLAASLLFGWPAYLLLNLTGGRVGRDGARVAYWKPFGYDHVLPTSALFTRRLAP
jgi:omega-6 fatty acid desaturase (delta-12 desaturase)